MDVMFQRHAGATESGRNLAMLTFATPSVAPSVAAWIGSLAAPFTTFFSATSGQSDSRQAVGSALPDRSTGDAIRLVASTLASSSVDEAGDRTCAAEAAETGVTYWPCERLNAFILQMAAHGHCVSAAMMLGHRPYAVQQLAAAQQVPDEALRNLAAELQTYFDAPPDSAAQQLAAL
jgi:hypothetical protein